MSKQQTAVDWLKDKINSNLSAPMSIKFQEMFEQAKELEKQRIIEAASRSCQSMCYNDETSAEQYYNDKYGQ